LLDLIKRLGLVSKNGGQMLAFVRRFLLYYAALVFVAYGLFLIILSIQSKNKVIFS